MSSPQAARSPECLPGSSRGPARCGWPRPRRGRPPPGGAPRGGGETLVAEAGTGSGKTLAYLIPSVLSGRKTVVSTGTKTLQQQIVENDVPIVLESLRSSFSCVVVKGRGNYLCRRRWKR